MVERRHHAYPKIVDESLERRSAGILTRRRGRPAAFSPKFESKYNAIIHNILYQFQHSNFGICPQYILIATYDQSIVPLLRFLGTLSSLLSNLKHQIRSRKPTDLRLSMRSSLCYNPRLNAPSTTGQAFLTPLNFPAKRSTASDYLLSDRSDTGPLSLETAGYV